MNAVSIPEFLDYFITPPTTRHARYATAAVRNSVNMLDLIHTESSAAARRSVPSGDPVIMTTPVRKLNSSIASSTPAPQLPTNKLELALLKLVTMWEAAEDALINQHLFKMGGGGSGSDSPAVPGAEGCPDPSLVDAEQLRVWTDYTYDIIALKLCVVLCCSVCWRQCVVKTPKSYFSITWLRIPQRKPQCLEETRGMSSSPYRGWILT